MFAKVKFILREMAHLIKREKLYYLAPLLIAVSLLAVFIYYVGEAVIVAFIYAGM